MRYLFICVLFLVQAGNLLLGQDCEKSYPNAGPQVPGRIYYDNDKNSENSPFLFDEWRMCSIIFINGYSAENVSLRYQAFRDQLVYLNRSLNYAVIVESNYVKEFTLTDPVSNKKATFRRIGVHTMYFPDSLGSFAQVLSEGHVSLFSLRIRQKKAVFSSYQSKVEKYYYADINLYYLQIDGGEIIRFEPSNSELRKILHDKKTELRAYMRKERLRAVRENDLIKAVDFYNTL